MFNCKSCDRELKENERFEKLHNDDQVVKEFYCLECVNNTSAFFKKTGQILPLKRKRR